MVRWMGAACLTVATLMAPPASAADVVVNAGVAQQQIPRSFLRGMFGMRLRAWSDGTPVTVFVLPDDNGAHAQFCTDVLQMFPYQLRQNWDRLIYSGTGQPPLSVNSEEELLRRVAATPGAIGYIGSRAAPAAAQDAAGVALPEQVRILHVR